MKKFIFWWLAQYHNIRGHGWPYNTPGFWKWYWYK